MKKMNIRDIIALTADLLEARGPMTFREYAEATGMQTSAAHARFKRLHSLGEIHITEWRRQLRCGPPLPVFAAGPGRDAKRPQPKKTKERSRDYDRRRTLIKPRYEKSLISILLGTRSAPAQGRR